jgi:hypothetical protein
MIVLDRIRLTGSLANAAPQLSPRCGASALEQFHNYFGLAKIARSGFP